jgi:hypothetical protein
MEVMECVLINENTENLNFFILVGLIAFDDIPLQDWLKNRTFCGFCFGFECN